MTEAAARIRPLGDPRRFVKNLRYSWYAGCEELSKRFSTSLLGGLWLFVGPVLLMCVYWIVFDKIIGVKFTSPSTGESVPFLAAFAAGFLQYLTFNELVSGGAAWFRGKRRLLTETTVPGWAVFNILVVRCAIQYVFYIAIIIGICFFYGVTTPMRALLFALASVPIFAVFCMVALNFALLGAFFGDVREFMPVLMRVLLYASSITFPLSAIPDSLQWLPMSNPLTWAVELSRNILIWTSPDTIGNFTGLLTLGAVASVLGAYLYWRLASVLDQAV